MVVSDQPAAPCSKSSSCDGALCVTHGTCRGLAEGTHLNENPLRLVVEPKRRIFDFQLGHVKRAAHTNASASMHHQNPRRAYLMCTKDGSWGALCSSAVALAEAFGAAGVVGSSMNAGAPAGRLQSPNNGCAEGRRLSSQPHADRLHTTTCSGGRSSSTDEFCAYRDEFDGYTTER